MNNKFVEISHSVNNETWIIIEITAWDNLTKTTYSYGLINSSESFISHGNRGFIHYNLTSILLKHDIKDVLVNYTGKYGLLLCEMIEGFKIEGININRYLSKIDYIVQNKYSEGI